MDLMLPPTHPAVIRDKDARNASREVNSRRFLGFCGDGFSWVTVPLNIPQEYP